MCKPKGAKPRTGLAWMESFSCEIAAINYSCALKTKQVLAILNRKPNPTPGLSGTEKPTSSSARTGSSATLSPEGVRVRGPWGPLGTMAPSATQRRGSGLGARGQAGCVSLSAEDARKVRLRPLPPLAVSRSWCGPLLAAVGGAERKAVAPPGPTSRLYLLRVEMHS